MNPRPTSAEREAEPAEAGMIEPLDPRDRFTLQAERDFRASVRPIYRNISATDRRPMHIASCLLLNVDGTPIVCTAAHVIDHLRETPLYVGRSIGAGLVPIIGGRIRAIVPKYQLDRKSTPRSHRSWGRSIPGIGLPPAPTGQKLVTGAQKLIVQKRSGAVRGRLRKWARNISCSATVRR